MTNAEKSKKTRNDKMACFTTPQNGFFSLEDLVDYLGKNSDVDVKSTRRTVRKHTVDNECPHAEFGNNVVFHTESFLQWLETKLVTKNRKSG